ncbi:methyl-CpG-binding domain protein 3 [Echinops telfairi]|uniref:Methyl-CpG-binding domain protein 3 n=1 Tax=Echinops telfairi TaxID=9371 RepID=A0AC59C731_ECHTE|nr:methyl-CpG-binding domain protein 3 [Echinops telfairi]
MITSCNAGFQPRFALCSNGPGAVGASHSSCLRPPIGTPSPPPAAGSLRTLLEHSRARSDAGCPGPRSQLRGRAREGGSGVTQARAPPAPRFWRGGRARLGHPRGRRRVHFYPGAAKNSAGARSPPEIAAPQKRQDDSALPGSGREAAGGAVHPRGRRRMAFARPREAASIFKQPVTKITNHPSNKVKSDPQKAVEQPRQLFWEKKLSGLNAFDIAEELVRTMDLPKGLQGVGPGCTDETLLSAIASALHTSTMPITGQLSAAVEKNPGVWLNTTQPLCKAFMVTDEDIRKQEELVQQVRKRLEEALMADMLAHVEELARDGETPLGKASMDEEEEEDDEDDEEEPDPDQELEHA